MENISQEQIERWFITLGKPTAGVLAFIILILYREAVISWLKMFADVLGSHLKKK